MCHRNTRIISNEWLDEITIVKHICFLPCVTYVSASAWPLWYMSPACSLTHLYSLLTSAGVLHHCHLCLDFNLHLLSSITCCLSTPVLCRPRSNFYVLPPATLVSHQEKVLFYLLCLFSPECVYSSFISSKSSMQCLWPRKLVCLFPRAPITNLVA